MKQKPASLPTVASFECSNCGVIHQNRDALVPVGWTQRQGTIWCADCTRMGIAIRQITRCVPRQSEKVRLRFTILEMLSEGQSLMPLDNDRRADWARRVNALLAEQQRAA